MVPGPDQALVTRNALVGGRFGSVLTMLGGTLGLTVHAGATAVGLSALLVASAQAFTVVKIVGAFVPGTQHPFCPGVENVALASS